MVWDAKETETADRPLGDASRLRLFGEELDETEKKEKKRNIEFANIHAGIYRYGWHKELTICF